MDKFKININVDDIKRLEEKYSKELVNKAYLEVDLYLRKISEQSKRIIHEAGHEDSGKLYDSLDVENIEMGIKDGGVSGKLETGGLSTATNYARFIHEGAKYDGGKIVPHFVRFRVAKSLLMWAERNDVIYQKTKTGKKARKNSNKVSESVGKPSKTKWYFFSKRTGKEYPIDSEKGGLWVKIKPTKFFEKPFESLKEEFVKDMSKLVGGE